MGPPVVGPDEVRAPLERAGHYIRAFRLAKSLPAGTGATFHSVNTQPAATSSVIDFRHAVQNLSLKNDDAIGAGDPLRIGAPKSAHWQAQPFATLSRFVFSLSWKIKRHAPDELQLAGRYSADDERAGVVF